MIVTCSVCNRLYDDAEQWTLCNHGPLWASLNSYCQEHDLVNCPLHDEGPPKAVPLFANIEQGKLRADLDRNLRRPFSGYREPGLWWFRIYGYGIHAKRFQHPLRVADAATVLPDLAAVHPLLFSEREGIRKIYKVGNWCWGFLKPKL
jgi:hypothetical protein